ncbi:guanylate kinase [Candidatus Desantisbacteria bacterium]|nr:guanylate kinase [Candidatus Desantisbacteria bacterium]
MKSNSLLLVISAPSGAGKTTVTRGLLKAFPEIQFSVSMCTRPKRDNERDGIDYFFVSKENFKDCMARGDLIEWTKIYDDYYGTTKRVVEDMLSAGVNVIFDIDSKGARAIKELYPDNAVLIFILPPFMEDLRIRLLGRMTDSQEDIEKRLQGAEEELRAFSIYDYWIINEDVDISIERLKTIIIAEKCRLKRIPQEIKERFNILQDNI